MKRHFSRRELRQIAASRATWQMGIGPHWGNQWISRAYSREVRRQFHLLKKYPYMVYQIYG